MMRIMIAMITISILEKDRINIYTNISNGDNKNNRPHNNGDICGNDSEDMKMAMKQGMIEELIWGWHSARVIRGY